MRVWVLELIGIAIPIVYMCMLPRLSEFAPDGKESYAKKLPKGMPPTLSDYIETPQATGAMALSFMWPLMYTRLDEESAEKHLKRAPQWKFVASHVTMTVFFFAFGLLLAFPVTYIESMHYVSVMLLSSSAMAHFAILLSLSVHYENPIAKKALWAVLTVGIVSMTCVLVFAYIMIRPGKCGCFEWCEVKSSDFLCGEAWQYCIFVSEVTGLSAFCVMAYGLRWVIFTDKRERRSMGGSLVARRNLGIDSELRNAI
eukprot:TRINITY_DN8713_c0_g1_i3.p1 TRINITY_DN8713_c0_g1~~TRINITY_DN8713_c0_g1_i3.p1  ORF type:complete len:256 (+),score=25.88 TRINITY_DN8713_c0_g1_i3:78-845(+)